MPKKKTKDFIKCIVSKYNMFKPETNRTILNELLTAPSTCRQKGLNFIVAELTMDALNQAFCNSISMRVNTRTVEKYRDCMQRGDKFPLPTLQYIVKSEYKPTKMYTATLYADGRHRILAAQSFCEKVPVMIVFPADPDEFKAVERLMTGTVREKIQIQQ